METKHKTKDKNNENKMREIKIEKLVMNVGGTAEKLDRGFILLGKLSGKKPARIKSKKRIPVWDVRPGLEVGAKVTLRGDDAENMLRKILPAVGNTIKEKQIKENFLSFGIQEYIEIPGTEYIREVGIMGFEVSVVFARPGKRVERKKIKRGNAKKQAIPASEIERFMEEKFKIKILRRKK